MLIFQTISKYTSHLFCILFLPLKSNKNIILRKSNKKIIEKLENREVQLIKNSLRD